MGRMLAKLVSLLSIVESKLMTKIVTLETKLIKIVTYRLQEVTEEDIRSYYIDNPSIINKKQQRFSERNHYHGRLHGRHGGVG